MPSSRHLSKWQESVSLCLFSLILSRIACFSELESQFLLLLLCFRLLRVSSRWLSGIMV